MKFNNKASDWGGGFVSVLIAIATGSAGYLFYQCRQDYRSKKEQENRENRRLEAERERAKEQSQAEKEDPELKLKKQDKEVKAYVFEKLGLDETNPPQSEPVCAYKAEGKRYSRPSLVGPLVSKGDLCVVVSQPGVGKSILASQMGDDIARGKASLLFPNSDVHQDPQPVFYWDAEMDSDDMKERYPEGLSGNFVRFSHCNYRDGFYLLKHIYDVVFSLFTDATIILDNWKALSARIDAYYFFTGLRKLQSLFEDKGARLTIIIVIHTTKEACKKFDVDLGDVAGAAEITRFAKTVLFVNPIIDSLGIVELHDAKRRRAKKNEDILLVLKGGEGTTENIHFEAISIDDFRKMVDDNNPDFEEKRPGRKSKFTDEDDRDIALRLERRESAEDIAKDYGVKPKTIYDRARRHRERNQ